MKTHNSVIIGEQGVGKTQIFDTLCGNQFVENKPSPTIAYNFSTQKVNDKEIEFIDVSGADKWKSAEELQLKRADSILYCVDFSKRNVDINAIQEKLDQLKEDFPKQTIVLVATKCDPNIRKKALKKLERLDIDPSIQRIATCAKDGYGISSGTPTLLDLLGLEPHEPELKTANLEDALISAAQDHPTTIPIVIEAMKDLDTTKKITLLSNTLHLAAKTMPQAIPYLLEAMNLLHLDAIQKTKILSSSDALMQAIKNQPAMMPDLLDAMHGLSNSQKAAILSARDNDGYNALMIAAENHQINPSVLPPLIEAVNELETDQITAILSKREPVSGKNALMLELEKSKAITIPLLIEPMKRLSIDQNSRILEKKWGTDGPLELAKSNLEVQNALLKYAAPHAIEVSTNIGEFKEFKGSILKNKFLSKLKNEIEQCKNLTELTNFKMKLEMRDEFKVLSTHQGRLSSLLQAHHKTDTDSVVLLKKAISEKEKTLQHQEQGDLKP